ncbi:DUF3737 family protein [Megamonas hypermegale]|uniref:DUF3737 family protein n=1 Tax=Megamonas hypermegale TaxID=158847 RepID=UPI0025A42DDA|nr:DUF3737 family protein [Megamonas hypermegale]MDM8144235.1 DUF3737 family protein [Megamonas hypermegale]
MQYINKTYDSERALYGLHHAQVIDCNFDGPADGESALKETANLSVQNCFFNLRYPLWHNHNTEIINSAMTDKCRAAMWYDSNITLQNCDLNGIKALRECSAVKLENCRINSAEFGWKCRDVNIKDCELVSEYPFFESSNLTVDNLKMNGKYSFQYVENATFRNCELKTKDAFWHSKNVTVIDSVVYGEYLGWYAENLTFIRCKIIGTQPLCYCKNLKLTDCTMEHTDLAFERSDVQAYILNAIDSVKNPLRGEISASSIGNLILETDIINPTDTKIICRDKQNCACA